MMGIYRIYNMVTGQSYIGQSRDISKRIDQHIWHRNAETASLVDSEIGKYGIHNFMFQIIELCDFNDLDWKEEYWINYFRSNIYGYNVISGGQHNKGESNSNCKLTSQDVYNIREFYDKWEEPQLIYNNYYKGKISLSYFYNVWERKSWPNIHMDVYTAENKEHYKNKFREKKRQYSKFRFSDEEVMYYRKRYVNETAEEIYNSANLNTTLSTFKGMLQGNSYRHLPYYNKKTKTWINN